MIVSNSKLVPKGYTGITIWPFIFLKYNKEYYLQKVNGKQRYENLIRHETIHLRQQVELLVVIFYILYGLDYLINLSHYNNTYGAYRNIVFEKEAYANEKDKDYLKTRKLFAWVKYFKK